MTTQHRRQLIVMAALTVVFAAGGVVLIVLGYGRYADSRSFASGATRASGTVTGFEMYDAPGVSLRDDLYIAMVRYTTGSGDEVTFRGPSKDGLVKLKQGDSVTVLYYPDDPQHARVDSFMGLWFAATMLLVLGGAAVTVPGLTLWQAWKWVKRQDGGG